VHIFMQALKNFDPTPLRHRLVISDLAKKQADGEVAKLNSGSIIKFNS